MPFVYELDFFQINPKETIIISETDTAYINLTLTIPIIPCSSTSSCPMYIWTSTPNPLSDNCKVTSLVQSNDDGEYCGTMFYSHDEVPVTKRIAIKAKASDTNIYVSREFGIFVVTYIPKHDFMQNQLLSVVQVSILVNFWNSTLILFNRTDKDFYMYRLFFERASKTSSKFRL